MASVTEVLGRRTSDQKQVDLGAVDTAVARLSFPDAIYKTCPWEPRDLVAEGLKQWLRCCGAALRDGQVIGMPSHAVDEAWHGFVLCTVRYARFCEQAYGRFLHHHPEGGAPDDAPAGDPMSVQLERTVVAWELVARPGEACVLFDLDSRVGVQDPWGLPRERVALVRQRLAARGGD